MLTVPSTEARMNSWIVGRLLCDDSVAFMIRSKMAPAESVVEAVNDLDVTEQMPATEVSENEKLDPERIWPLETFTVKTRYVGC